MRAASTAWTVSGTIKSGGSSPNDHPPFRRASIPRSASVAISSSAKNGFPSARSATSSRIGAGQPLPSSARASCSASATGSASSRSSDAPPGRAQPGR